MATIKELTKRLDKIGTETDSPAPRWLSPEEVVEWRSIPIHSLDRRNRIDEFIRKMRMKHPDIRNIEMYLLTYDEQIERDVYLLKHDPEVRRREGLSEED